jgi:hypoxanthine phosphoribosyltransferase
MSSDKTWPNILAQLSPETKFFGLIALLAEAALIAVAALLPSGQRIYALVVFLALLVLLAVASRKAISRSQSHDHNQPLQVKVATLKQQLIDNYFLPQLIVAISRGGLAVAGMLAKQLAEKRIVPVIALTPDIALTPQGHINFDNGFNIIQFTREDFDYNTEQRITILIVDDICRRGATLAAAKAYLEAATDRAHFVIETAALSVYAQSRATPPSFFAESLNEEIRDSSGQLEPLLD